MLNLSLDKLKLIAKFRGIKDYESTSEDKLLSVFNASKPVKKSERNFDDTKPKFPKSRIEMIRKNFKKSKHTFSKSKINEIRRNLFEIENKKNLSAPNIKND